MSHAASDKLPHITVVVVTYNAGDHLVRAIECLLRQTFTDFHVVVVDNGSEDDSVTRARARATDPRFRFIEVGENLGYAAANNFVARETKSPWFATLNPDAFPEPGWLDALHRATMAYPDVAAFGSTQIDAANPNLLDGCGDVFGLAGFPWRGGHKHPVSALPPEGETFSACGAAALYKADAFREAGGFDERFFCYVEDVDLGYRLRLLGYRCRQVNDAVVHHVGGGTTGPKSAFTRYHGIRNAIWCFAKNTPGALLWPMLPFAVGVNLLALGSGIRHGTIRTIIRAQYDALAGLGEILRERRRVQARRRVGARQIAHMLCWSLFKMWRLEPIRLPGTLPLAAGDA